MLDNLPVLIKVNNSIDSCSVAVSTLPLFLSLMFLKLVICFSIDICNITLYIKI